jgi:CRP-like cAMP-binding protein
MACRLLHSSGSSIPRSPEHPERKLLHIGTLMSGDYFGEIAILSNSKEEPISVVSEGQVEVFMLPKIDFNRCIFLYEIVKR